MGLGSARAAWGVLLAFLAFALVTPATAAVTERSVYYTYDVSGRQLTAKFDSVGGSDGITNAYNGFGDLTSTTSSSSGTARTLTYAYDGAGRRIQVTHPDGQAFTYAYDDLSRLSGVYQGIGTGTPLDTFSYGTNGLVTSRSETGGSSAAYGWDDAGRLTSQTDAFAGGTGNVGWTFGFNSASQIASESRTNDAYAWTGAVGVNRPYTVNGLNQYTSAGPASFTYDANGNLTGDGTWTYAYDVENRLVSAVGGGISATLSYDPLGRLSFIGGSNIGDVQFLYDGDALVLEFNSANAIINRYVHGSNAAADDPLVWYSSATVSSATRHWFHADHLGSIIARVDASGANPVINTYDEYGIPGSANTGRFGYTGQTWLYEIGLDYYKARIYSPTLGRFLQTDPIGYEGGLNLYGYAIGDPMNNADPTGNWPDCGPTIESQCAPKFDGPSNSDSAKHKPNDRRGSINWKKMHETVSGVNRELDPTRIASHVISAITDESVDSVQSSINEALSNPLEVIGEVAPAFVGAGILAAPGSIVQFGRTEAQVAHTYRHVLDRGFSSSDVALAIRRDLARAGAIPEGTTVTRSVIVDGSKIEYQAHRLSGGVINVGSIRPPRP